MPSPASSSYDELPYEDVAYYHTHPNNLATVATLCGLKPPAIASCRVLELGCGAAYNLLAMAHSIPQAHLVGVDFSARQIEQGQATARQLGVNHLELHTGNVAKLNASLGQFDYIIGHGIFSWVPERTRDAILELCKKHLAPNGIAYLSYNTYPGWHHRNLLRDALRFHAPETGLLADRVQQARQGVNQMLGDLVEQESHYAQLFRSEVASIRDDSPVYLAHEYLEPENKPLYFQDFAKQAAGRGLQYLAEARYETSSFVQLPDMQKRLDAFSSDLLRREQYHDFLRNRYFRQSLLCQGDVTPPRTPDVTSLMQLYLYAQVECLGTSGEQERFRLDNKKELTTAEPMLRALLHALQAASPGAVRVEQATATVVDKLADTGFPKSMLSGRLLHGIMTGYRDGLWLLLANDPPFARAVERLPVACPLARFQATRSNTVTNRLHRSVELTPLQKQVVPMLDGTKSCDEIAHALSLKPDDIQKVLQLLRDAALLCG